MRPVDKAFVQSVMFELGVIPIQEIAHDMRVPLKQLDPVEARVLKRKFRKLWRKYSGIIGSANVVAAANSPLKKDYSPSGDHVKKLIRDRKLMGAGKRIPSREERQERKRLVYTRIWHDIVSPMLDRFEASAKQNATPAIDPVAAKLITEI
jgi:hypothetical protein